MSYRFESEDKAKPAKEKSTWRVFTEAFGHKKKKDKEAGKPAAPSDTAFKLRLAAAKLFRDEVTTATRVPEAVRQGWASDIDGTIASAEDVLADGNPAGALAIIDEAAIARLRLRFIDQKAKFEAADKRVQEATDSASKSKQPGAIAKAADARLAFSEAKGEKDLAPILALLDRDDVAAQGAKPDKDGIKAAEKYVEARAALEEAIGKAQKMRGADSDSIQVELIGRARRSMAEADSAYRKPGADGATAALTLLIEPGDLLKDVGAQGARIKERMELDVKSLKGYQAAYAKLARTRAEIAALAGASDVLAEADQLMLRTRIVDGMGPKEGYAKALSLISTVEPTLQGKAKLASSTFLASRRFELPGVGTAIDAVESALQAYASVHPKFQEMSQRAAFAQAQTGDDAIKKLEALEASLEQDTVDQLKRKNDLTALNDQLTLRRNEFERSGLTIAEAQRLTRAGVDELATTKDFAAAIALAHRTLAETKAQIDTETDQRTRWKAAQARIAGLEATVQPFLAWPSLEADARSLALDATAPDSIAKRDGLELAIASADRLAARLQDLQTREQALKAAFEGGPAAFTADLEAERKRAREAWDSASQPAVQALATLATTLRADGVADAAKTNPLHLEFGALGRDWTAKLAIGVADVKGPPADVWTADLATARTQLADLAQRATDLANNATQRQPLVDAAKAAAQLAPVRALWQQLSLAIAEFEALGLDGSAYRVALGAVFDPANALARVDDWNKMLVDVNRAKAAAIAKVKTDRASGQKDLAELKNKTKSRMDSDRRYFVGFFEGLEARMDDAKAMLESDDADLVATGLAELRDMKQKLRQAKKGDAGEGPSFDDFKTLESKLSGLVGSIKNQPDTLKRLKSQLMATIAKASTGDLQEAYAALQQLQGRCEEAVALDPIVADRKALLEDRIKQVQEEFDKVRDRVKTGLLLKASAAAYEAQVEVRLAEVKAEGKREGGFDTANTLLNALAVEVEAMLTAPVDEARVQLKNLDGAAQQEQRELKDLVTSWNKTLSYWKKIRLPEVEAALKKREGKGKQGVIAGAVTAVGDTLKGEAALPTEYVDFSRALDRAALPVKPYVELVESLDPRKVKTTDMTKTRQAFAEAHKQLLGLERTAERLVSGDSGTTKVDLVKDLHALQVEWGKRANNVGNALQALGTSIKGLPAEATPDDGFDAPALATFTTQAGKVAAAVATLRTPFLPDAFAAALGKMASGAVPEATRLQAREQTLRSVRGLRDHLSNPLLMEVRSGIAQGLLDVDLRNELALLNASLSKIELAVLAAF